MESADSGRPLLVLAALGEETIMESNQENAILADIQRVARLLNTGALSMEKYEKNGGNYSREDMQEGMGSFSAMCEMLGLKAKR